MPFSRRRRATAASRARGFESRQPVNGKGMPEVVAAFGKGADQIAREIIDWTIQNGSAIQAGQEDMAASASERILLEKP